VRTDLIRRRPNRTINFSSQASLVRTTPLATEQSGSAPRSSGGRGLRTLQERASLSAGTAGAPALGRGPSAAAAAYRGSSLRGSERAFGGRRAADLRLVRCEACPELEVLMG
jgi:hypothetical protein